MTNGEAALAADQPTKAGFEPKTENKKKRTCASTAATYPLFAGVTTHTSIAVLWSIYAWSIWAAKYCAQFPVLGADSFQCWGQMLPPTEPVA